MAEINKEDFGILCVCALRYCMGRRTYMPSLVTRIIREHFSDLDERDISSLLREKEHQEEASLWGDDIDKVCWKEFWEDLEKYVKTDHPKELTASR